MPTPSQAPGQGAFGGQGTIDPASGAEIPPPNTSWNVDMFGRPTVQGGPGNQGPGQGTFGGQGTIDPLSGAELPPPGTSHDIHLPTLTAPPPKKPEVFGPPEAFGPPAPTTLPQTDYPKTGQAFQKSIMDKIKPNCLNPYYQTAYHFRLFAASEMTIGKAIQAKDIASLNANIRAIPQVTIVETGVTGYNIREVEIETIAAANPHTRDQKATTMTMTVTEPMGVSFLDALAHAGKFLGIKNYTKAPYYLQLSFTGYKDDGSFAGNPIQTGFPNGGIWVWSVIIRKIDVKLNEGGGVYTLQLMCQEDAAVLQEASSHTSPNTTIVASGDTLGELFQSYQDALNKAWKDNYQGGAPYEYKIITHPVPFPPYFGRDPKSFTMVPKEKDKTLIRPLPLEQDAATKKWTVHVPPRTPISEFITSAIKTTEEGQELFKNEPITDNVDGSSSQVNNQQFRVSTLFAIEPFVDLTGVDTNSGNYVPKVEIHVTPHYSQEVIATRTQVDNAANPDVQKQMLANLSARGFLQKRYDYIFTGQNTEVIDFNIAFNMVWQAKLPKFAGRRLGYNNEAVAARVSTTGTSPATSPFDDSSTVPENKLNIVPLSEQKDNTPAMPQHFTPVGATTLEGARGGLQGLTGPHGTPVGPSGPTSMVGATGATAPVTAPTQSNNIYIEDILSRMAQGQRIDKVLPVSFVQNFYDVERETGTGTTGQDHRGKSVMGLALQIYDSKELVTGAFQKLDLTIRGDPFWLGLTNFERRLMLKAGKTLDPAGLPDYSSGKPCVLMYFKYPLMIGDDFKPQLRDSECFNGVYQVNKVTHTFSEGSFKQKLLGTKFPLMDPTAAFSTDSNSTGASGNGSPPDKNATNGGNSGTGTGGAGTGAGGGSGNQPVYQVLGPDGQPTGKLVRPDADGNTFGTLAPGETLGPMVNYQTPQPGTSQPNVPRGITNKNPTNLGYNSHQVNVTGNDGPYGQFPTMEDGIAAATHQLVLNQTQKGASTLYQQLFIHWDPGNTGHVNQMAELTGIGQHDQIDVTDPATVTKVMTALIQTETSAKLDPAVIAKGIAMGLKQ
jgi:hypothetical protein